MKEKTKNIIVSVGFFSIIILVFLANIIVKDKEISLEERRKLAQFPKVSISKILNGDFTNNFDKYVTDQFIARNTFRSIKSFASINIFRQKDNNNLFEKDGAIYKMEYPLSKINVNKNTDKIKEIYNSYLKEMNVYYAIIPDKNYYLKNDDHLKIDYDLLKQLMNKKLANLRYIDIWDSIELESYYKTDLHWKQENLIEVANTIKANMNLLYKENNYEKIEIGDFYGTYFGQISSNINPDKIYILNNEAITNCTTYNYETKEFGKIYYTKETKDKYDIFLSGATSIITIENNNSLSDKELLLFRDSFGSSIAPLLVENYRKITLIDLRYVSSKLLDQYIEFKNQDVLFLYSTVILNQDILK